MATTRILHVSSSYNNILTYPSILTGVAAFQKLTPVGCSTTNPGGDTNIFRGGYGYNRGGDTGSKYGGDTYIISLNNSIM